MNFPTRFFIFGFAVLLGFLSVLRVSPGLHSSFFHGPDGCPYSTCNKPCGSEQKEDNQKDELPCPAVLFGQFFLGHDYFARLSVLELQLFELDFILPTSNWVLCSHHPYGARAPPSVV